MDNFLPQNDGTDHINVYSKGRTELGRFLSNFAYSPVNTQDGPFNSIEGYWYWLSCDHPDRDKLRELHGFGAKKLGRELRGKDWNTSESFKSKITRAIELKVRGNEHMMELFAGNELPLAHYYVFYGKTKTPEGAEWIMDCLRDLHETLKNEATPQPSHTIEF